MTTFSKRRLTAHEPLIRLDGITFQYNADSPHVLRDLSLSIEEESVTAILGPNGSGKTTLMNVLLGRLPPLHGGITINGRQQADMSRREMSQTIGLVPQDEEVPFEFTVLDYVVLGRAPYLGWLDAPSLDDYEIAQQAIESAGLSHLATRTVPSLSGGERQLTRLARALAQTPQILLLDEPTSHLDMGNVDRVLQLMRSLADSGVTVVFSSHDPTSAASVADMMVLVHDGQTIAAGPTDEVLTSDNLRKVYGADIEVHTIDGRLVALPVGMHRKEVH